MFAPWSTQLGTPAWHAMAPAWHGFDGVQATPAVHTSHAPPRQIAFAPQLEPSFKGVDVSVQTGAPVSQVIKPTWHGFDAVQPAPFEHATQLPARQT